MDIVKLSTDWAKAEVFSAKIVWLFSAVEIMAAIGFLMIVDSNTEARNNTYHSHLSTLKKCALLSSY